MARKFVKKIMHVIREGVRGVAGVASATPYFGQLGILK